MSVECVVEGTTAILTLQSPDGLNRLSRTLLRNLAGVLFECEENSDVRGIVITAEGRTFSAGADIDEFPYGADADAFLREVLGLISTPERIGKPVIAAIDRSAIAGGFELALSCDWIVADSAARFGLTEIQFGFIPGYCMTRLPFLVGEARARRLMLDPGPFGVDELAQLGIHISSPGIGVSVRDGALAMCQRMEMGAPTSVRLVKRLTNRFVRNPDFEAVVAAYNYLFQHSTAIEGVNAFKEGRQPDFWSN